jgi:hypothetical protein
MSAHLYILKSETKGFPKFPKKHHHSSKFPKNLITTVKGIFNCRGAERINPFFFFRKPV